jgi:rhodanese-related sulfurtransferase
MMRFIRPRNLDESSFILDVRSPEEYQVEELKLPHIHKELAELDPIAFIRENHLSKEQTIHIICASGARASQAAEMFEKAGFNNVAVIIGGMVEAEYEGLEIIRH